MKLAILGGSFNPVHLGHVLLAEQAVRRFGYDTVAFVPAYKPPHKQLAVGATNEDRCAMLSLAIADYPEFKIETSELDREGVSYTIDTVRYLQDTYATVLQGNIGLIIGEDLVNGFHLWKDVKKLVQLTDVLLAFRGTSSEYKEFSFPFEYTMMENAIVDISSQEIRNRIQCGKDWKNLVHKNVYEYIQDKRLYVCDNR